MSESPTLFSSDDEGGGSEPEEILLKKFQTMMQGVPPPPSITMSRLSANEMLSKYNENLEILNYDNLDIRKSCKKKKMTPLVYYFNSSSISEEIANLSQKVLSRFVYSETMSTCNVWFEDSTKLNSAKKYAKQHCSRLSPGRRLSHLARRRQTFSSENLQKLAHTEKKCQIEIGKQSISKSKSFLNNKAFNESKSNSFKRALFLSPDDGSNEKQKKLLILNQCNVVPHSTNYISNVSEKHLWISQSSEKTSFLKEGRKIVSREKRGNWPRRALTFTEKDMGKNLDINSSNMKVISEIQLNLRHKTKILWAVSVTLKEKNINSNNSLFKSSASALFMICRKNLNKILDMKIEGGTSDKILHFAREHVDDILRKLKSKESDPKNLSSQNVNNGFSSDNNPSIDYFDSLKNNKNFNECPDNIGRINSNNETQIVSAGNENDVAADSSCKVSGVTISTMVNINPRSCEKENINLKKNNCNLLSAI